MIPLVEVVGWLVGVALLWRVPTLAAAVGDRRRPRVSVVVPARDEAASLPRLLDSLARQDHPPAEIVVVDDESTDGTGAAAAAAGARVLPSGGPPAGWTGKTWACHRGAAVATGDVLVFLDADTWLAPDGIDRLVAAAGATAPGGLLSVQPFHVTVRPYEQLSAVGNLVAVMASGMAVAGAVGDPRRPVAFGACLVTTPAALAAAGGFAAVRDEAVEDLALARRYQDAGLPVRALAGGDTVRFRMYPDGPASLVRGWTRTLAAGAWRGPVLPVVGTAVWVTGALSVGVRAGVRPGLTVALAWLLYAAQLAWGLRRVGSFHWWAWALFPVPVAAFVGLAIASAVARLRRRVTWRGRRVALGH